MKVNVEIECSPEEARRFLGLPDVSKANDVYVDALARAMQGVSSVDQLQGYASSSRRWARWGSSCSSSSWSRGRRRHGRVQGRDERRQEVGARPVRDKRRA
jgi:hypothetical protein